MKRLAFTLMLCTLAACGGDSSTGPKNPTFPSVAGVFAINGTFAGSTTNFSGTVTFVQPSRDQPALSGSCNITVFVSGESVTFVTIDNASISESGAIGFNVGPAGGQASWRFAGNLSGSAITGTHDLSDGTTDFVGTFTATKQ